MTRASLSASVRVRAYSVVARAVEEGVAAGWSRAHKHTDSPEPETIRQEIDTAVMNALCDVLDFDQEAS